jgi:hypothetical protein
VKEPNNKSDDVSMHHVGVVIPFCDLISCPLILSPSILKALEATMMKCMLNNQNKEEENY